MGAFVLLFIAWMAVFGMNINLTPDVTYATWIIATINFLIVTVIMMIIPFFYKITWKKEITKKMAKSVCKANILIVLIICMIIDVLKMGGFYDNVFVNMGSNLGFAIIYYFINYKIFFKKLFVKSSVKFSNTNLESNNLKAEEILDTSITSKEAESMESELKEINYVETKVSTPKEEGEKMRFCSKCGAIIDNNTKQCTGCGKQYFKGFKVSSIIIILLTIALAIMSYLYVNKPTDNGLYESRYETYKERYEELEEELAELKRENANNSDKLEFMDDYVACVEDDGTNYYHRYECDDFAGEDFWIYNIDWAEQDGYKPCPKCH